MGVGKLRLCPLLPLSRRLRHTHIPNWEGGLGSHASIVTNRNFMVRGGASVVCARISIGIVNVVAVVVFAFEIFVLKGKLVFVHVFMGPPGEFFFC